MNFIKTILIPALIITLISCGGNSEKSSDETKEKKEVKEIKKGSKEWFDDLLSKTEIKFNDDFKFLEVKDKSNGYAIVYIAENIDSTNLQKFNSWYNQIVEKSDSKGWKKVVVSKDETITGLTTNEVILYPPKSKDIDVTYGIGFTSVFIKSDSIYKVYVSAD